MNKLEWTIAPQYAVVIINFIYTHIESAAVTACQRYKDASLCQHDKERPTIFYSKAQLSRQQSKVKVNSQITSCIY